jgi:hypothetical protein
MLRVHHLVGSLVAMALTIGSVHAGVDAKEAQKLKGELTPFGAERAGNKAGTIPKWEGGLTEANRPKLERLGQHHIDPYAGDKPLFTITAANMAQYSDQLSDGQKKLFQSYPDSFKMNVYPSRRSHSAPEWVYENTVKNATTAKLAEGGNGILGAVGGIPFPIAKSGGKDDPLMMIWNHITRWRGVSVIRDATEVAVQRNGDYTPVTSQQEVDFVYYHPNITPAELNNRIFYYLSFTKAPARLAGGAVLVHETLDQTKEPRQAWGYNAGQRRVRRAPNLAYDTPIANADGLRTADDTDMFNGAPDRYNWTYVGKKEMYVPYNNYELGSDKLKYQEILTKGHINPDFARYELHRVWIVEANLKPDARHIYKRRVFFIDEDSWSITMVDQYDSRDDLWRVSMAYLKNYYDVPTTWSTIEVFHDLQSQRYHVQNLTNEERSTLTFKNESPPDSYFSPNELRRRGIR